MDSSKAFLCSSKAFLCSGRGGLSAQYFAQKLLATSRVKVLLSSLQSTLRDFFQEAQLGQHAYSSSPSPNSAHTPMTTIKVMERTASHIFTFEAPARRSSKRIGVSPIFALATRQR